LVLSESPLNLECAHAGFANTAAQFFVRNLLACSSERIMDTDTDHLQHS